MPTGPVGDVTLACHYHAIGPVIGGNFLVVAVAGDFLDDVQAVVDIAHSVPVRGFFEDAAVGAVVTVGGFLVGGGHLGQQVFEVILVEGV